MYRVCTSKLAIFVLVSLIPFTVHISYRKSRSLSSLTDQSIDYVNWALQGLSGESCTLPAALLPYVNICTEPITVKSIAHDTGLRCIAQIPGVSFVQMIDA